MTAPFTGGRGDPPPVAHSLPVRVAVMHVAGANAGELFETAGVDRDALDVIAAMEQVRPGGARPDVLALVAERLSDG